MSDMGSDAMSDCPMCQRLDRIFMLDIPTRSRVHLVKLDIGLDPRLDSPIWQISASFSS